MPPPAIGQLVLRCRIGRPQAVIGYRDARRRRKPFGVALPWLTVIRTCDHEVAAMPINARPSAGIRRSWAKLVAAVWHAAMSASHA